VSATATSNPFHPVVRENVAQDVLLDELSQHLSGESLSASGAALPLHIAWVRSLLEDRQLLFIAETEFERVIPIPSPISDVTPQTEPHPAAQLLSQWEAEGELYDDKEWSAFEQVIEENRLSDRKCFGD
jgi:hypothetical protein